MKEYKQDRGGGIVVDSAETYRGGLVMLGSMITNRAQSTIEQIVEYNNSMIEELLKNG